MAAGIAKAWLTSTVMTTAVGGLTFTCGEKCYGRVMAHCDDSLRVQVAPTLDMIGAPAEGALREQCTAPTSTMSSATPTSVTNGRLTASWQDGVLSFVRGVDVLFASTVNGLGFVAAGPLPPPTPAPQSCPHACGSSVALGHDVDGCPKTGIPNKGEVPNVTRSECCSICGADKSCAAFAWGTDAADPAHRHVCYLCSAFVGFVPRTDRDSGCVGSRDTPPSPPSIRSQPSSSRADGGFLGTYGAFTSDPDEVIVGLGQHSHVTTSHCGGGSQCGQWKLNQKGFTWDLGITKFQIMVPFYVSSKQYGFLWNHPGEGTVTVANDSITWNSTMQRGIDFWVTAGSAGPAAFADILHSYADATGHAPQLPDSVTGFWQSKMRYRTSDEIVDVAAGFAQRGIPLSVLVIDFYTWTKFGDFQFDSRCWPNVSAMVEDVKTATGAKILRSTYPWFDTSSVNYKAAVDNRVLVLDREGNVAFPINGMAVIDPFQPGAARFVWSKVKASFFDHGIEMFWLDDTEPNIKSAGLQYHCGPAEYCGALWAQRWVEIFVNGTRDAGIESPVMLTRAAWAGFQTTGAVLWSSDIPSTFESLQIQVRAGLSATMSGLPWWTTDVGGFVMVGTTASPEWPELIVRWYQFGALCPIFRTHGARMPKMTQLPSVGRRFQENGSICSAPNGITAGGPNEPWSYGEDTEALLVKIIDLRESLRSYIHDLAVNASRTGAPPMRPMFFDFPLDHRVWPIDDQFMFGPKFLVAPILAYQQRNRSVYFPFAAGTTAWVHYFTNASYQAGSTATVDAPLAHFPLFIRVGAY